VILVDLSVRTLEDLNSSFEGFPFWSKVRPSLISDSGTRNTVSS
jgi:hypothetical protein